MFVKDDQNKKRFYHHAVVGKTNVGLFSVQKFINMLNSSTCSMPSLPQTSPTRFPKPLSFRKRTAKCKQELTEQLLMKTEPTETEEIGLSTFKGADRARPSQKGFLLSSLKY